MAPPVNTDDLVGAAEVAQILQLSNASGVSVYVRRYSDFPRPVVELPRSKVRLWLRHDIEAFRVRHPRRTSSRPRD